MLKIWLSARAKDARQKSAFVDYLKRNIVMLQLRANQAPFPYPANSDRAIFNKTR
jgi:hypothetical protein